MSQVADWGQGRYYFANDSESVPRIFTSETILVARTLVEEHTFVPSVRQDHEVLRGIEPQELPPLRGYVLAYPKPAAEVLLVSDKADPVLAVWRYGLGRTAAFTADLRGRWGKAWVEWEDFGKFASQLVRWTQRKTLRQNMWMNVALQDGKSEITVDLYDNQDEFINNATLAGTVTVSGKASTPLPLEQTAPGRYKGSFEVKRHGRVFHHGLGHGRSRGDDRAAHDGFCHTLFRGIHSPPAEPPAVAQVGGPHRWSSATCDRWV